MRTRKLVKELKKEEEKGVFHVSTSADIDGHSKQVKHLWLNAPYKSSTIMTLNARLQCARYKLECGGLKKDQKCSKAILEIW